MRFCLLILKMLRLVPLGSKGQSNLLWQYRWWDSLYYGVDSVQPESSKCPPDICMEWFESLYNKIKRIIPKGIIRFMVPVVGLEPTRCLHQRILSPPRLPFQHTGKVILTPWSIPP